MIPFPQIGAAAAPSYDTVGPGIAGFFVIFALALATVLLVRSMVGHLRKVRYGPGPQEDPQEGPHASPHDGAPVAPQDTEPDVPGRTPKQP